MTNGFTINSVENMSNEKADEINKAAEDIDSLIDVLKGQEKNKYRNKNVAHRGFNADREVTIAFLNAVKGISTIEDEKYKFFIEPISKINFDTTLQNIRKGNYGKMDEIKTAQKSINAYMKEYGLSVEVDTTLREKRDVTKIINSIKWKRGEDYNKKREGEKDYEISINKEGKGSISFYSNDEKLKTVEFQIGKDGKIVFDKTTLYQILEDGWLGVETLRALSVVLNDIAERNRVREEEVKPIPIPVKKSTEITLQFSLQEHYKNKIDGKEVEHFGDLKAEQLKIIKGMREIIDELSPEELLFIASDPYYKKYNLDDINIETRDKKGNIIDGTLEKIYDDFKEDMDEVKKMNKNRKKEQVSPFYFEKDKVNTTDFEINYDKLKEELKKIGMNDTEIEGVIYEIEKIKKTSKDLKDFNNKINKNEIVSLINKHATDFAYLPLEQKLSEQYYYRYNNETKEIIDEVLGEYKIKVKDYISKKKSGIDNLIELQELKKDYPKAHEKLINRLHSDVEILEYKKDYEKLNYESKVAVIESKDFLVQSSQHKPKSKISMMEAKKIPTQKDLDALKENIKSSPALAKLYKNWYNEEMKKAGLKGRIDEKNPTKEFDRMGIDFWHQIKKPEEIMEKHLVEYKKEVVEEMKDQFSLDSEFEKYVRMRTYEGKGEFDLQLNELNEDIKKKIAWDRYGIDFMLRDQKKVDKGIEKTRKEIMDDKVECMAFQLFVNEYLGSRGNIKVDGIPGNITKKYMKEPDLLTLYYHMRENNAKERDRLLTAAKETEQKVTIAKK